MAKNLLNLLTVCVFALTALFYTSIITWSQSSTDRFGNPVQVTHVGSGIVAFLLIFGLVTTALGFIGPAILKDKASQTYELVNPVHVALCFIPGGLALAFGFMTIGWRSLGIYQILQNACQTVTIIATIAVLGYLLLRWIHASSLINDCWSHFQIKCRPQSDQANLHRCLVLKRRFQNIKNSDLYRQGNCPRSFTYQVESQIAILSSIQTIIEDKLARDEFRVRNAFKYIELAAENSERYIRLVKLSGLPAERESIPQLVLPTITNKLSLMMDKVLERERISIEVSIDMIKM